MKACQGLIYHTARDAAIASLLASVTAAGRRIHLEEIHFGCTVGLVSRDRNLSMDPSLPISFAEYMPPHHVLGIIRPNKILVLHMEY